VSLTWSVVGNTLLLMILGLQVNRGFVAEVADVIGGRQVQLNAKQRAEGKKLFSASFPK